MLSLEQQVTELVIVELFIGCRVIILFEHILKYLTTQFNLEFMGQVAGT